MATTKKPTRKPTKTVAQKKKDFSDMTKTLKKGALRATMKQQGLIKGKEKISADDLTVEARRAKRTGNTKLAKRVTLAKTFKKMATSKKSKK